MSEQRKHIEVVAAIIRKDNTILATQRGYGDLKDGWEFPGGKIEPGEAHDVALIREIKEELEADINVQEHIITIEYTGYEKFDLTMHCYLCSLVNDSNITLVEHEPLNGYQKILYILWIGFLLILMR